MKGYRHAASGLLVPLAVLAFWQLLSSRGWVNATILPSPMQVLVKWWAYLRPLEAFDPSQGSYLKWCLSGELIQDAAGSLYRVLTGFLIGAGLALPLGLAMGYSRLAYGLFNPLIQVLRPIPPIAYIPLSILWFGLGNPPAIFLIAIGAFFPVLMNTVTGVQNVDGIYFRVGRNLGASRWTQFTRRQSGSHSPTPFDTLRPQGQCADGVRGLGSRSFISKQPASCAGSITGTEATRGTPALFRR